METWVHEGVEVTKTGREATRELKNAKGVIIRTMVLVEIKPVDESFDWKKWVDPAQLFTVR